VTKSAVRVIANDKKVCRATVMFARNGCQFSGKLCQKGYMCRQPPGLEGRPNAKMLAQVRATEGRYKRRSDKR